MDNKLRDITRIEEDIIKLQIEKNLTLEKNLMSDDVNSIYKAQKYLQEAQKGGKPVIKSFLFDPYEAYGVFGGYKQHNKRVSFEVLKKVADTPIVGSILSTRIFQMQNFLKFTNDENQEGYTIRKKLNLFDKKRKEPGMEEKKKIEYIVNFLESGGLKTKWDITDDLGDFLRKTMRDSLTYDQLTAECQRNRQFQLIGYNAIDASTIRILETIDPRFHEVSKQKYELQFGQLPRYAQVYQSNIVKNPITNQDIIFYPWELIYAQRNKATDINKNFYGTSEIEVLLDIITWSLWGMQYNGNFFKQGSNPKGFINIKDEGVNMDVVNDFRQTWRQMIAGVANSHKIPVFSGIDLEWIDLQGTNKDMEFQQWMEFLIIMLCSVFTIDPSELGYQFNKQSQMFGQQGVKERLEHSKKKGLKPLLLFWEKIITKWIVSEIDSEYEFSFTGIDTENEAEAVDLDSKKLTSGQVSFESVFEKNMGRPYNPAKDTILNPVFLQMQQMKQYGGQQENQAVDEENGGEGVGTKNPFEEYGSEEVKKAIESNPIMKECLKYVEENIN